MDSKFQQAVNDAYKVACSPDKSGIRRQKEVSTVISTATSSKLNPSQKTYFDLLVRISKHSRLNPLIRDKCKSLLKEFLTSTKSTLQQVPTNSSIDSTHHSTPSHPSTSTTDKISELLNWIDHEASQSASAISSRYESVSVRTRVFKSEYVNWWNTFIPGSRVLFLSPTERNALQHHHIDPFKLMNTIPEPGLVPFETYLALYRNNGTWFISDSSKDDPSGYTIPAIIACPKMSF